MSGEFETFDWECEVIIDRPEFDQNKLHVRFDPRSVPKGNILYFELNNTLQDMSEDAPDRLLQYFSKPFGRPKRPERSRCDVPKEAKKILTGTLEGQMFLEHVIAKRTDWIFPLNISTPEKENDKEVRYISDIRFNKEFENESPEKWRVDDDYEQNCYVEKNKETLTEFLGIPVDGCYVIRLVDKKLNHWLYVGKSVNIPKRLRKHQMKNGDFSKPESVDLEFLRVEDVRDDISERELYKEVCSEYDIPEKRIRGGR